MHSEITCKISWVCYQIGKLTKDDAWLVKQEFLSYIHENIT